MKGNINGYVRVPAKEQNEDRRLLVLRDFVVLEKNIYMDKFSGKDFNWPQYRKLLKKLWPGSYLSRRIPSCAGCMVNNEKYSLG